MSLFIRKLFVFSMFGAIGMYAQHIGAGVRIGTPLSDFLSAESKIGAATNVVTGKGNLIVGPMFELRLPLGLGVEVDALYRRWDPKGAIAGVGSQNTWEIPVYGKYRFPGIVVHPYVGAGVNFQRIGDVGKFITGSQVDSSRIGYMMAGGVEAKIVKIRISPELRYTRWNNKGALRSSNQVDLLVGFSF